MRIICPHCGNVTRVYAYGTRNQSYEAILNLDFTEDELRDMLQDDKTSISIFPGVLDEYDCVEEEIKNAGFTCSRCGTTLSPAAVLRGQLAYMQKQDALYVESTPSA